MSSQYMPSPLINAIQTEHFELANSLSAEFASQATPESAETTIHNLSQALELARVIRAHLAVRAASTARQSAYESSGNVAGRWTIEA